jgi:predicted AAA+ superfamily ATPase
MASPAPLVIPRAIAPAIGEALSSQNRKIVLLYGPRQAGKTTLANQILANWPAEQVLRLNGDLVPDTTLLASRDLAQLKLLLHGYSLLFIDEAQRIPDIGIHLKILHDHFPGLRLFVTGSSSFDLANQVQEPLTGRTRAFTLYPLSAAEISRSIGPVGYAQRVDEWMLYGSYPGIYNEPSLHGKTSSLAELTHAYLYKDVLELSGIRHSDKLHDLLQLLAYQIGSEVSYNELGRQLGLDTVTVQRYVDLLRKAFVIQTVSGFSKNLRKEISKRDKIYFLDTGIRNTLIDRFTPLSYRDDKGRLWENFLFIERMKLLANHQVRSTPHFWRLHSGAEIDYVEQIGDTLTGFEFKYNRKAARPPASWSAAYPDAGFQVINTTNWYPFVTEPNVR